ncbi:MAG: YegP family protein [Arthrobacter sp.]|nr:YegP family protein [Arthrobacter sp.]MDZ4354116.1 YegP family protein [Arthrobacter sp.]
MPKISPVLPSAAPRAHALRSVPHVPGPARPGTGQGADVRQPAAPGKFELVRADGGRFLIRILDGTGAVLARSGTYPDLAAAVEGVEAVRECAATSHISDQTAQTPDTGR